MRRLTALFVSSVFLSVTVSAARGVPQQAEIHDGLTRTIYVSVLNNAGSPITDLAAADFVVKRGGKDRAISEASDDDVPLRIAL